MDSPGVQVTWTVRKKFSLFSFLNFLMASIYLFMQRNSQKSTVMQRYNIKRQKTTVSLLVMANTCGLSTFCWFMGTRFLSFVALQYRTIHYFVKCLRGLKFVGRVHPQNPRTPMPREQCWFHSTIKEMKTYCIPTLFISWQKEN